MIVEILNYIQLHWVEWLFAGILSVLAWGYRIIYQRLKESERENKAISEGVQALLRESIIDSYNKYSEKGSMPIYAKESTKRAYRAYHALGGNDVAKELYEKMLEMPEPKASRRIPGIVTDYKN